jgi:predicted short-subunit dehydrogenase-like oxidoreductase (DUF2520 family)
VGTAVAVLLRGAGHRIVGVGPHNRASSARASRMLGADVYNADSVPEADVILLGVPDEAVAAVAEDLPDRLRDTTLVVHFSGALGLAPLGAVGSRGGVACALHPVQACPDVDTAVRRLPGSAWGVTCPPGARERAEWLVREAGGRPVAVAEADRAVWHAAAAVVANGTSALLAAGEAMLAAVGVSDPSGVLGPLAAGTVANARERGDAAATLTGPVARGDVDIVRRHLAALEKRLPALAARYRNAGLLALETARDAGRLSADSYAELLEALEAR